MMSSSAAIDAYARLSSLGLSPTLQAGRYAVQADAEALIAPDVAAKLALDGEARLLDIGCGPGNLVIPLAPKVKSVTALDHPDILRKYADRLRLPNVTLLPGVFPQVKPEGTYDRILCYSVLHYMADMAEARAFLAAAAALLAPQGRLLMGDMPALGKKARFLASDAGKAFDAAWRARSAAMPQMAQEAEAGALLRQAQMIGGFDDSQFAVLVADMQALGCHAYVLPQPPDLPFGNTRDDLLVIRP